MSEPGRTDLSVQCERAILVKLITRSGGSRDRDPLAELDSLARTAGAVVVDGMIQRLSHPIGSTYLGTGKVDELAERVKANQADLVIFDDDLTPAQIRVLEERLGCKIIDRSELILDIFAARARTHEAKLQVELAQLQYTAPRLRGMWSHLERIAGAGGATGAGAVGGIGTRGPGERQIEIDRRIVRKRMSVLKDELSRIDARKLRAVRSRKDWFTVSLVGYTNAGKTTLMNALTGTQQYAADKLFATLDTKTTRWQIDDALTVLLSDTVGFVRDLPHRLVASFRATLEEALNADLLLHVVDASHPEAHQQARAVERVLVELECQDIPTVTLLNKIDDLPEPGLLSALENRIHGAIPISARAGTGLERVKEQVRQSAWSHSLSVTLRLSAGDGKLLATLDREAKVLARRYEVDFVELDVIIDRRRLQRIRGQFPTLAVSEPKADVVSDRHIPVGGGDSHSSY